MLIDLTLTPADPAAVAQSLAYASRYSGGKRVRDADDIMARIAAERLFEHLKVCGFVVMKKPLAPPHRTRQ